MSRKTSTALSLFATALLCSGCVSDLNRKEGQMHFSAAQQYDFAGDYASAREQYWKALVDARLAGADPATISLLAYNFGRTSGYTCHFDDAEKYLTEALEMEKGISGPESGISTKRIFELARLYLYRERYKESAAFYAQGIPLIEKLGIVQSDPIALADILDQYAIALDKIDNTALSGTQRQLASNLRTENPGESLNKS